MLTNVMNFIIKKKNENSSMFVNKYKQCGFCSNWKYKFVYCRLQIFSYNEQCKRWVIS